MDTTMTSRIEHTCIGEFPCWKLNIHRLKITFPKCTLKFWLPSLTWHESIYAEKLHNQWSCHNQILFHNGNSSRCLPTLYPAAVYTINDSSYSDLKVEAMLHTPILLLLLKWTVDCSTQIFNFKTQWWSSSLF